MGLVICMEAHASHHPIRSGIVFLHGFHNQLGDSGVVNPNIPFLRRPPPFSLIDPSVPPPPPSGVLVPFNPNFPAPFLIPLDPALHAQLDDQRSMSLLQVINSCAFFRILISMFSLIPCGGFLGFWVYGWFCHLQLIADQGLVPSPEEEVRRKLAIQKLKQVFLHNLALLYVVSFFYAFCFFWHFFLGVFGIQFCVLLLIFLMYTWVVFHVLSSEHSQDNGTFGVRGCSYVKYKLMIPIRFIRGKKYITSIHCYFFNSMKL